MVASMESGRLLPKVATAIREMHPSHFSFVMATGIISTGTFLLGPSWLSQALFVVASMAFMLLVVMLVVWLVRYRSRAVAEFRAPKRVFGFFAICAGTDVLGQRFALAGHPMVTTVLASAAAAVWLVLTYAVPASLVLARQGGTILNDVDGTWLLWVIATVSLSIDASTLVPVWPSQSELLAAAAVSLWGLGVVLYLLIVSLIWHRWLTVAMTPAALSPPYWILLGGTAILVLAGSDILAIPGNPPAVGAIAGFVKGTCFVLWSFGTWWIPLLVLFGFWRYVLRRWPRRYEPTLWTVVFPIGMYSVASVSFGKAADLSFMEPLGRGVLWVALAAWLLVAGMGVTRLALRTIRANST
jgi:tellurite resistance protein TehA-like permease